MLFPPAAGVLATLFLTAAPPVRLAAFACPDVPADEVRSLLGVELGGRFVDTAGGAGDFVLLSVACDGDDARLLAVRQGEGSPLRRVVPLGRVAPKARARHLAVAAAELLRDETAPAPPPAPAAPRTAPVQSVVSTPDDDEGPDERDGESERAPLALAEPLVMSPLTDGSRAGARTRAASTELRTTNPENMSPNFYVFSIEPFLDVALARGVVATLVVPVTWSYAAGADAGLRGGAQLANVTAGVRYASGDDLRFGVGAALSLGVGNAAAEHAESNLFELDRFRDDTSSLRLAADVLWRTGRLYMQGEAAVLLLASGRLGSLLRGGAAGGYASDRWALGLEYLVLTDFAQRTFVSGDRVVQALIAGARWTLTPRATLGLHLQLTLDQGPNLQPGGVLSLARAF